MSRMEILLHGGKCCGIKHIFGLEWSPAEWECSKTESKSPPKEKDGYYNSPLNVFIGAAPKESKGERFDRYLTFIKETRPYGIIEVVLSNTQYPGWNDFLLARGFQEIVKCWNSNSGGYIRIYHLVSDKPVSPSKPVGDAPWTAAPIPGPIDDE